MKKKVLIFTVTAGNAHNACANGMKKKLLNIDSEIEVKVVDLLHSYSNWLYSWLADGGYNWAVSRALWGYDKFYNMYKRLKPVHRYACPAQGTSLSTVDGVMKEIWDFEPDVIYCTHFYPAIAITDLRLVYDIPCKVIVLSLDYVNSPFWEAAIGVDYFAIPNEDFIEECIEEGFTLNQLLPLGLPVNESSLEKIEKSEARKQLGIDENLPTIMVMFGGGNWSGGFKIFNNLLKVVGERKVQILMINGRDNKSFKKIEKMSFSDNIRVVNVGFTDQIYLYMSASDFILSKCGGASVTEAMNIGLPLLVTTKIPAQEKYNLKYMEDKGVSLSFNNKKELEKHVSSLLDDSEKLNEMVENTKFFRKNAIGDLAEFILEQPDADYTALKNSKIDFDKIKRIVRKYVRYANKQELRRARKSKTKRDLQKVGEIK